MTILGFCVEEKSGNIIEPATGQVLTERAMSHELRLVLKENGAPLDENFERLERLVHYLVCDDFISSSIALFCGVIIIDSFVCNYTDLKSWLSCVW